MVLERSRVTNAASMLAQRDTQTAAFSQRGWLFAWQHGFRLRNFRSVDAGGRCGCNVNCANRAQDVLRMTAAQEFADADTLNLWLTHALQNGERAETVCPLLFLASTKMGITTPARYGSEGWYWAWNKAGFRYMEVRDFDGAAKTFAYAYLTALHIQCTTLERLHKGMPLCNYAVSRIRGGSQIDGRIASVLGMIEDALTSGAHDAAKNFGNLISTQFPRREADRIGATTLTSFRGRGRQPLFPESVLHNHISGGEKPDQPLIDKLRAICSGIQSMSMQNDWSQLAEVWSQFTAPLSIIEPPHPDSPNVRLTATSS